MERTAADHAVEAVLAAFGLAFGIALIGAVKEQIAHSGRYSIGPLQVAVGELPEILESRRAELFGGARPLSAGVRSLYDPTLPADLQEDLLSRPWVAGVSHMRRRAPDTLRVRVRLRTPVAVVCIASERLAVDRTGVVIESWTDFGPPAQPEIHLLAEDVRSVPRDGCAFERASVREALAVLEDLERERRAGHPVFDSLTVEAVLIGFEGRERHAGDADVQLRLASGTLLLWGRSRLSPLRAYEIRARRKLDHLERTLRAWPGLVGLERVDLRANDPLVYLHAD